MVFVYAQHAMHSEYYSPVSVLQCNTILGLCVFFHLTVSPTHILENTIPTTSGSSSMISVHVMYFHLFIQLYKYKFMEFIDILILLLLQILEI